MIKVLPYLVGYSLYVIISNQNENVLIFYSGRRIFSKTELQTVHFGSDEFRFLVAILVRGLLILKFYVCIGFG